MIGKKKQREKKREKKSRGLKKKREREKRRERNLQTKHCIMLGIRNLGLDN